MITENHRCEETEVEAWGMRHFEPDVYAAEFSGLNPKKAPEQATDAIAKLQQDLMGVAQDGQPVCLSFQTSRLKRAVESTSRVLNGIDDWLRNGGPANISIANFKIEYYLDTTRGPTDLINQPKWLPDIANIEERRAHAYLGWLLIQEEKLRDWGIETPSDIEFQTISQWRHSLMNNSNGKQIIHSTLHEPLHGALFRRHTRDQDDLAIKFGERFRGCITLEGVVLHWRDMPGMLTRWDDVLANNSREEQIA